MESKKSISHSGVISSITADKIKVNITQKSACAGCHAKSACTMADMKEKSIEIRSWDNNFSLGETVNIIGQKGQNIQALTLGYLLPLVIVVAALFIGKALHFSDVSVAALSLCTLPPYYGILYLNKNLLKKTLQFTIEKTT